MLDGQVAGFCKANDFDPFLIERRTAILSVKIVTRHKGAPLVAPADKDGWGKLNGTAALPITIKPARIGPGRALRRHSAGFMPSEPLASVPVRSPGSPSREEHCALRTPNRDARSNRDSAS